MAEDILQMAFEQLVEAEEALESMRIKVLCPACHKLLVIYPPVRHKTSKQQCSACGVTFYVGALYVSNVSPEQVVDAMHRAIKYM